jgi:uncharacterized protein (UPF0332 family)
VEQLAEHIMPCLQLQRLLFSLKNIEVKTHTGLCSAFGSEFIKTGIVEKEFGRILSRGEHLREEADYGSEKVMNRDEAEAILNSAKSFVSIIKELVEK